MDKDKIENYNIKEDDLNFFFDNFIKTGEIVLEKEVVPGFTVRLRPLSTGQLLSAEAMLNTSGLPNDISVKIRCASILSQAILAVNGMEIESDDNPGDTNALRRANLYSSLLKMPPVVIEKAYRLYVESVSQQNEKYDNVKGLFENSENF